MRSRTISANEVRISFLTSFSPFFPVIFILPQSTKWRKAREAEARTASIPNCISLPSLSSQSFSPFALYILGPSRLPLCVAPIAEATPAREKERKRELITDGSTVFTVREPRALLIEVICQKAFCRTERHTQLALRFGGDTGVPQRRLLKKFIGRIENEEFELVAVVWQRGRETSEGRRSRTD